MLYESNYNQYFLEHSWGPWKKHLYISRDEKNGKFVYKYPQEYYEKYRNAEATKFASQGKRGLYKYTQGASNEELEKMGANNYNDTFYNTSFDKVINNSVKAAVSALNFGMDMKDKAENYLTRFGNAVANAWNKTKTAVSSFASTGKRYLKGAGYLAKTVVKVTAPKVAASVRNLIKGAGEAVSKGWKKVKDSAQNVKTNVSNTIKAIDAKRKGAVRV